MLQCDVRNLEGACDGATEAEWCSRTTVTNRGVKTVKDDHGMSLR